MLDPVRPPIAGHAIWPELKLYINLSIGDPHNGRFPLMAKIPADLLRQALALEVLCCHCGVPHHPVRGNPPAIFSSGPRAEGHGSCSYGNDTRACSLWLKIELGKVKQQVTQQRLEDWLPSDGTNQ